MTRASDTFHPQAGQREQAWRIMRAALQAVEPSAAVKRHVQIQGNQLVILDTQGSSSHVYDLDSFERVLVVGGGKAGAPMADAVAELLGSRLSQGIVVVKYEHTLPEATTSNVSVLEAGHPIPDQAGLLGTQQIKDLLLQTTQKDLVLCLISGGGSALLTLPSAGISLADLQALTQLLLGCGATINEINTVRKHLSQLKGGQLARLAHPATVVSLILSDVVGDPLDVIASGPTVADPSTFGDAWSVLTRYQVENKVPDSIRSHLEKGLNGDIQDTPKAGDVAFEHVLNVIIASNRLAAYAAAEEAQRLGFDTTVLTTYLEGEARQVARVIASLAKGIYRGETRHPPDTALHLPACIIVGGETTVTLEGDGKGGRNQEMALAAALALEGWPAVLVACLATDGTDGPTDAAGAFADGSTVSRAAARGLEAADYLQRNDSYHLFQELGDLIVTGPTQTNVNDLILILVDE